MCRLRYGWLHLRLRAVDTSVHSLLQADPKTELSHSRIQAGCQNSASALEDSRDLDTARFISAHALEATSRGLGVSSRQELLTLTSSTDRHILPTRRPGAQACTELINCVRLFRLSLNIQLISTTCGIRMSPSDLQSFF